jgi:uncharacterized protein YbjQ (UPF0145 family)
MDALAILAVMVVIGYVAGSQAEKRHYAALLERETELSALPVSNLKQGPETDQEVEWVQLVYGNTVIAVDYFKVFVSALRNLLGGQLSAYESLIDRARRESVLRMKEMAQRQGADLVINLRIEAVSIGKDSAGQKNGLASIEALAYGTAIRYRRADLAG